MKNMLICGANGFIGKNAINKFKKNYNIRAVDLSFNNKTNVQGIEWLEGDLTKKDVVEKVMKDIDIVLQYAAVTSSIKDVYEKPYLHVTDNVVMNSLLIREAYEQQVENFIFPSCTVMYTPSKKLSKEEDFLGVVDSESIYFGGGTMKVFIENTCNFFSKLGKTKFTVIRQSDIYGPRDKYQLDKSHVFAATITKVMKEKDGGEIVVWGDGSDTKDFLYIEDLLNFIEISIRKQNSNYEVVNLGSSELITIKQLAEKVIRFSKKNIKIKFDLSKPSRKKSVRIDCTKVKKIFGWQSEIKIEAGINNVINWYKSNY